MKFKSAMVTAASGKIGGMVASHNRGGMYFRSLAIPTNPNTPQQQVTRASLGQLAVAWRSLPGINPILWDIYAAQVPLVDAMGDPIFVSGINMFIRSNTPRLNVGLPVVEAGPSTYDLGEVGPIAVSNATEAGQTLDVDFAVADAWVDEDDSAMLVYLSRPHNPSTNFFKGPYRFAGQIPGDSVTPPTSPATITAPFPFLEGQRIFYRINVSRADGRLSQSFRGFVTGEA
jgi:hypothetical protein